MQLSLAAYSMRKFLRAKPGSAGAIDMEGFVDYCKKLRLDGTELTSYFFPQQITDEYLQRLKKRALDAELIISGGAIGNNYTLGAGSKLDEQIEHTRTWIRHYTKLGAPAIRVFAGRPPKGVAADEAIKRCVPVLEQMSEEAGKHGIKLALENHDFTTDVKRMMAIVKAVKSKWFGVNFDSGNFHSDDPYRDMQTIAPYTINAQIKTEIRRAGQQKEEADLPRVIKILRDAGYAGWVVLEYESAADPYTAIPQYIDKLRKILVG
jgi:sugar phosphate isomerase/epimerase